MSRYAADTNVPASKSRDEIERLLQRYGADHFMYGWDQERAMIRFNLNDRMVQFLIGMPDRDDPEFWFTPTRRTKRTDAQAHKEWEQATRQRWRALKLVVQAKLEAVEAGIATFDQEFLAYVLLPDGSTVGAFMVPQVEEAYASGVMPSVLPALGPGE